eukprot:412495-Prymnesium_polylepis.1
MARTSDLTDTLKMEASCESLRGWAAYRKLSTTLDVTRVCTEFAAAHIHAEYPHPDRHTTSIPHRSSCCQGRGLAKWAAAQLLAFSILREWPPPFSV